MHPAGPQSFAGHARPRACGRCAAAASWRVPAEPTAPANRSSRRSASPNFSPKSSHAVGMGRTWLQSTPLAMLTALILLPSCACLRPGPGPKRAPGITRRAAGCGLFAAALASSPQSSLAFDNGVPEMARFKNEKKSGVDIPLYTPNNKKPLGLQDSSKLATCNEDTNCFSTSGSKNLLEVWSPKAGDAQAGDAMGELLATLKAYPPGQNGACTSPGGASSCIDGAGFQIVSSTPSYLYVQFASLKYVPHARSRTVHVPPMCPCASPASYRPLSPALAGIHR